MRPHRKKQEDVAAECIANGEDLKNFVVEEIPPKGRGVRTTIKRSRGDFLLTYHGELVTEAEGERREEVVPSVFRYFFQQKKKGWCIDATSEPVTGPQLGRLVNHGGRDTKNCVMKTLEINRRPYLCLFAAKDIEAGEELLYDYGINNLPWEVNCEKDSTTRSVASPEPMETVETDSTSRSASREPIEAVETDSTSRSASHEPIEAVETDSTPRSPVSLEPIEAVETDFTSRSPVSLEPIEAVETDSTPRTASHESIEAVETDFTSRSASHESIEAVETDSTSRSASHEPIEAVETDFTSRSASHEPIESVETDFTSRSASHEPIEAVETDSTPRTASLEPIEAVETDSKLRTVASPELIEAVETDSTSRSASREPIEAVETDSTSRSASREPIEAVQTDSTSRSASREPIEAVETDSKLRTVASPELIEAVETDSTSRSASREPIEAVETDSTSRSASREPIEAVQTDSTSRSASREPIEAVETDSTSRSASREPIEAVETDSKLRTVASPELIQAVETDFTSRSASHEPIEAVETDSTSRSASREPIEAVETDFTSRSASHEPIEAVETDFTSRSASHEPIEAVETDSTSRSASWEPIEAVETDSTSRSASHEPIEAVETDSTSRSASHEPIEAVETDSTSRSASHEPIQAVQTDFTSRSASHEPIQAVQTDFTSRSASHEPIQAVQTDFTSRSASHEPIEAVETDSKLRTVASPEPIEAVETDSTSRSASREPIEAVETDSTSKSASREPIEAVETDSPFRSVASPEPMETVETDSTSRLAVSLEPIEAVETDSTPRTVASPQLIEAVETDFTPRSSSLEPIEAVETDFTPRSSSLEPIEAVETDFTPRSPVSLEPIEAVETDFTPRSPVSLEPIEAVETDSTPRSPVSLEPIEAVETDSTPRSASPEPMKAVETDSAPRTVASPEPMETVETDSTARSAVSLEPIEAFEPYSAPSQQMAPQLQTTSVGAGSPTNKMAKSDQKQLRGSIKVFSNVDRGIQIFPMFSTVCVFGRSRNSDIIVDQEGVLNHDCQIEINEDGEAFLVRYGKTSKYLKHNDEFLVGRRAFIWEYPVTEYVGDSEAEDEEVIMIHCGTKTNFNDVKNLEASCHVSSSTNMEDRSYSSDESDIIPVYTATKLQNTQKDSVLDQSLSNLKTDVLNQTGQSNTNVLVQTEQSDTDMSKQHTRWFFRNIRIEAYETREGKRNYSRTSYCFYCKRKYISKISKHLLSAHSNEACVREIRDLPIGSSARKMALQKLQKEGNYQHNVEVLKRGEGLLIVCRRPEKSVDASSYIPCEYCYGFFHEKQLWAHTKCCNHRTQAVDSSANCLRNGRALLSPFLAREKEDFDLLHDIISKMKETVKNPGLKELCYQDELIKEFGIHLLDKLGTREEQRRKDQDNIRTKMRCVARLLLKLNESKLRPQPLSCFISAQEFLNVTKAVKELSRENDSPQLAVNLGGYLKQISLLKRSLGRREENKGKRKEAEAFDEEFNAHWNSKVTAVANRTKRLRSMNKTQEIPATEDLVKLNDYLIMMINQGNKNPTPSYQEYVQMTQVVIARVALFNMRRIAEVDELKVADYLKRINGQDVGNNAEILQALDVTEKALLQRMQLIEVRGKSTRGIRKVFILLTPDMVKGIEYLLRTRGYAGVNCNNVYVFGRTSQTPQDGCKAMRDMSKACPGLKNPDLIRTRLLRRYLATTTQIMDMSGEELKMVADHMGHSIQIHTDVYKLQSSVLERTKVARALVAIQHGKLGNFKGQNLSSINVDEIPKPFENGTESDDEPFKNGTESDNEDGMTSDREDTLGYEQENVASDEDDSDREECIQINEEPSLKQGIKRKRWSDDEERDFYTAFGHVIDQKKNVSSAEIRAAQNRYKTLEDRSEAVIRSKVNNILLGKIKRKV